LSTKQYVYPAQFIYEDNGSISVYFPDLEGCQTYDDTINGATIMAKDALEGFIGVLLEMGKPLPEPSDIKDIAVDDGLVMMVVADVVNIQEENKPVKKILSIPKWLDREANRKPQPPSPYSPL